jgi:cellulose synthase/poly-beta-1,6-N-acetylglucosamine synthase-like glycosyltransferase
LPLPTLEQTLKTISPRLNAPIRPWTGPLIWMAAVTLFILLFAQGFIRMGIAAWAVGLVYIVYDTALLIFVARRTQKLMTPPPPIVQGPPVATLAVIVAAYNEAAVLEVTIEALLKQECPPDLIVIADDGSDDYSEAVLAHVYGLRPPLLGTLGEAGTVAPTLRWLRLPRSGKARALNVAIPLIDADILLTVDADTLLEPGALMAMRRAFDNEPAAPLFDRQ